MGFRRYVAPSAREALERIRKELGPEAVILSNRRADAGRIEIIAAAPGEMRALVNDFEPAQVQERPAAPAKTASVRAGAAPVRRAPPESFQEFIRRQSTVAAPRIEGVAMYSAVAREHEATTGAGAIATRPAGPAKVPASVADAEPPAVFRRRPSRLTERRPELAAAAGLAIERAARAPVPAVAPVDEPPAPLPAPAPAAAPAPADARVMAELQSLRSVLSDRITNLEAQLAPPAAPVAKDSAAPGASGAMNATKRRAMTRLLMSGFSPELARRVGEAAPTNIDPKEIEAWLQQRIGQQIRCPADGANPLLLPGAVALVGPTGVGKTTTIAKLAARFVVRYGAGALGLITLDSYRIGAHEQLRSYGRILGVSVHSAHDAASLRDLLAAMHGKRQALIDTCGMSQRDPRLAEMLAMLGEARFADREIQRVLLINAASHAETLDEVARAWHVESTHGTVLTKIDEAARIGGALDAMMRFQVPLLGLTNGQRVPEDWHPGNPPLLAHIALKPFGAAFALDSGEIQALSSSGALLA